jgi:hypothetical protein
MKNTIIVLVVVLLVGVGIYFFITSKSFKSNVETDTTQTQNGEETDQSVGDTVQDRGDETVIGQSVQNRNITAYHYGTGDKQVLFVGGTHGGYSWNTVLVAYELMDYLEENPSVIPSGVEVTVIPVLNPDGLNKVVGTDGRFVKADVSSSQAVLTSGRFNANNVDLSRNFDCNWKSSGVWQTTPVSGGSAVFSEPESLAFKNYVELNKPDGVVVWYSAAGGVFSSSCGGGILPETRTITNVYATASGYKAYDSFDFYETSGDIVGWLAKNNIPAISVLLTNHTDTEWNKNQKGIDALLEHYAQ